MPTCLHARLHVADALAVLGARIADFGARGAYFLVLFAAGQHDMGGAATDLGASRHETKVLGLGVVAAGFKAVAHGRAVTGRVAFKAGGNAVLHGFVEMVHLEFSWIWCDRNACNDRRVPESKRRYESARKTVNLQALGIKMPCEMGWRDGTRLSAEGQRSHELQGVTKNTARGSATVGGFAV